MKKPSFIKSLAACLSLILLANNVLAYAHETNFWKERKEAIQLASLLPAPEIGSPLGRHSGESRNLALKPAFEKNFKNWIPASAGMTGSLGFLAALPASLGSIRKINIPPHLKSNRVLLHIQDVHLNSEAQTNIGAVLQS